MLSISNVSNSAGASSYYEQADDYYSQDRSPSIWSGRTAEQLNLSGDVRPEDFRVLLDGKLPNGDKIHRAANGRRGGTDLTFSAPKSVSMQAMLGNDKRLFTAHENAVSRALTYAESIATCRVTHGGLTKKVITANILVAQFRHDLSRAADPQLHTHCVVLNITQRHDGEWRAVDNEPFYRQKMLIGAYYRSELAKEVQALGYVVRITHNDGRFELSHIAPAQIEMFSSRSRMIEEALKAQGLSRSNVSAQKLQTIALQTREKKTKIDRVILKSEWEDRALKAGIDFNHQNEVESSNMLSCIDEAKNAVAYSASHISEREAVMRETDLIRFALERGTGKTDLSAIRIAINQAVENGALMREHDRYTTQVAQEMERDILNLEKFARNQVRSLMKESDVDKALAATNLNDGQQLSVKQTLTSQNRVTGIQGLAGSGKTTALRVARALTESQHVKVIGLAPSASAAHELSGSGIKSQTLAAFAANKYQGLDKNTLIVLDEASMVSVRDMHALLKEADSKQSRVLLVGDVGQLSAIEAGKPFAQLQQAGMETAKLDEIQRQQDPTLRQAVELAADGAVYSSLQKLNAQIVEIEYHKHRHEQMAADYAAMTLRERSETLIVSGTNNNRQAINEKVRESLDLAGKGETFNLLTRKDMTQAQALRTTSYQAGDIVRAEKDYKSLGLARGEMAQVIEGRAGIVTLERKDGEKVEWRPTSQPNMATYTQRECELSKGDLIRFTENDYRKNIINGDRATVIDSDKHQITVEKSDGSSLTLDTQKPLHLDYGYCQTVHSAQGQTCNRIMVEAEATSVTNNEKSYYVAISRARNKVAIYTDNRELLPETLSRQFEKSSALEIKADAKNAPELEI
ncbi:MobF family relaxase [Methylotenera sp.]|uniref:MobF family relaxase n=1 Tax=Methylotenera sp. TaxID=2051956 RepID=UPI002487C1DB|nr:MobF family relaxase [Methylotenera sp.]MDI1363141.1 MobF family relaxase [Methylotenera sp.]